MANELINITISQTIDENEIVINNETTEISVDLVENPTEISVEISNGLKLSANDNNRAIFDSTAGLYVPDLDIDPLAYYILSKS